MDQAQRHGTYTEETMQFMQRILETSGLGEETYMPPRKAICRASSIENQVVLHVTIKQCLPPLAAMRDLSKPSFKGQQGVELVRFYLPLPRAGLFDHPPWHAQLSLQARRHESEMVMFTCIKDLLHSCKVRPSEVRGT